MQKIDLGRFQEAQVRVFAGRDRGKEVRRATRLDDLDHSNETVEVHVPENTFAVNSSFFLAMFGDSIRYLKEDGFRGKYQFTGKDISRTIDSAIKDALHMGTSLSG
jgi:hypothetical protein